MQDVGYERKNETWYQKLFRPKKSSRYSRPVKNKMDACVRLVIRPLRIFQFLVVLLIFVLIIYTIMLADPKLSSVMCILLIVLSGVYLFVLSMDLINQFMGDGMYTIPMFIFSFLGTLLFGAAGIFLIAIYTITAPWYILTIAFVSLFAWILFVIDVSLLIAFWKHRSCNLCPECTQPKRTKSIQWRNVCHPACTVTAKRDLTTSVSSVKVASGDEGTQMDHSYRKTREGHRRQYVDCPTSARMLNLADAADIQTEIHYTSNAQSQTQRQMKEAPVQTLSKCELCNRQIQIFPNAGGAAPCAIQQECTPCPALLKLLSGTPCCPGCRCVTGIIQVSQQSQQRQMLNPNEQIEPTKDRQQLADKTTGDMLTSSKDRRQDPKVAGTITKVTLASYCVPSKKTNAASQTTTGQTTEAIAIKDKKSDEQQTTKRLKAAGSHETKDKEREKSEVRKKNESSKKKSVEISTKKVYKSSVGTASDPVTVKPMETSTYMTARTSQASSTRETVESSADKATENSAKELENSADNRVESSKENVPLNNILSTRTGMAGRISESSTDEQDTVSKNQKNSTAAKKLKFRAKKGGNTSSDVPSSERYGERRPTAGSKKMSSPAGPSTLAAYRPKEVRKDADTSEEIGENNDHSERKRAASGKSNAAGKKVSATISISKLRVHAADSSMDTSSDVPSELARKVVDSDKGSDDESKNGTARSNVSAITKTERSQETESIYKPNTETQTTVDPRRKKTYGFKRKNKVQPDETTYAEVDIQTCASGDTNASTNRSQDETLILKKLSTVDDPVNICPSCKRLQRPASSSLQYHDIYKDKHGRTYCNYCAPPNSVKVLHKKSDQKHLKCAGCGQSIPIQSSQNVPSTSDNCPHCGQEQVRVQ